MPLFLMLLFLFFLIFLLHFVRKRKIVCRIRTMKTDEKLTQLAELITPLGYCYDPAQDAFSTTLHPWQRAFGYGTIYDKMAPHFQMVFDCLPVYFDYNGQTWLIELWKGQYGINVGAEIGVYHADKLVAPSMRNNVIFDAATDEELLPMSLELKYKGHSLAGFARTHWWLTAFQMGCYSPSKELSMSVSLTFPEEAMMQAFTQALKSVLPDCSDLFLCGRSVLFTYYDCSSCRLSKARRLYLALVQFRNRILCELFLCITRPFSLSLDRVLYLYAYAPFAFRRLFSLHHNMRRRYPKR